MGNPFTTTSVINYNTNPPPDDGSAVPNNRVQWSTQKTKLADPVYTAFNSSETNTQTAFGKVVGGAGITSVATNYQVAAGDQSKLIIVTASATITTPDATVVGAPFVFFVSNQTTSTINLTGANPGTQQNVDGVVTLIIPAGAGLFVSTDGTNWFTSGKNYTKTNIVPQGRLTLVSGTAVINADETAKTAVFYTPYQGNQIPIPNGTSLALNIFSELTLTLNGTNYIAGNIYDVFVSLNPSDGVTVIIGSGPAWTTATPGSCERGTGAGTTEIALLNGIYVNNNAITLRNNATTYSVALNSAIYVGSIFIDTTNGQLNCHVSYGTSRKWDVWNAFNRVPIYLKGGDITSTWTYATASYRSSNNAAANNLTIFSGLAEENYNLKFDQYLNNSNGSGTPGIAIGFNSVTVASGKVGQILQNGTAQVSSEMKAEYLTSGSLGINTISALEIGSTTGTPTFNGTETHMVLSAIWRG